MQFSKKWDQFCASYAYADASKRVDVSFNVADAHELAKRIAASLTNLTVLTIGQAAVIDACREEGIDVLLVGDVKLHADNIEIGGGWGLSIYTGKQYELMIELAEYKLRAGGYIGKYASKPAAVSTECPCGIWRADCDYHR